MDVIGRLITAVKASGLKRLRVAADAGMTPTKLSKILNRKQVPTVPEFIAIARAIDLDPSRLFTDSELVVEIETVRAALALAQQMQATTETLAAKLEKMLPEPQARTGVVGFPKTQADRSALPVSAAANPNAEMVIELEVERKEIPRRAWDRGARIIARVVGDSMDGGPDPIRDGELAYLKPTRSPRNAMNKIALIARGDGLYLKTFEQSGHTVRLVSANSSVEDVVIDARAEDLRIHGYVVHHAPEWKPAKSPS